MTAPQYELLLKRIGCFLDSPSTFTSRSQLEYLQNLTSLRHTQQWLLV